MKKLLAYQINGQSVGVDIPQWNPIDLNGNQPFLIILSGETIPSNYADISSIMNWNRFGCTVANDYLVYKNEIKTLIHVIGWTGLTNTEKDIAIQYYAYDSTTDAVIYLMQSKGMTQDEAKIYLIHKWHKHHKNVIDTCQQRWYYVKYVIPLYLAFADCEAALAEPRALTLITQLLDLGLLGTEAGDSRSGILNFVESSGDYVNNGLKEMGFTLLQGTWEEFILAVKNVLFQGIYTKYDKFEINQ